MFPPAFAPRMGYICKYLLHYGCEVNIVTESIPDTMYQFLSKDREVEYVDFHPKKTRVEWFSVFLKDLLYGYKDKKMVQAAEKLLQKKTYDGILCSTYRTFPLPAALHLAQKYNLPFIADCRDIVEQYPGGEFISSSFHFTPTIDQMIIKYFKHHLLKERNRALLKADAVTTVSSWHVEVLKAINPHTHLIFNGFDPALFYPKTISSETFNLTYAGRILSLKIRNPRMLLEALRILIDQKKIDPQITRVQWYMDEASNALIRPIAHELKLENQMVYNGFIEADQIPQAYHKSAILLQIANKMGTKGPKGIMTTKLFESFAVEKPVLCIPSDENCLETTIKEAKAGIAARTVAEATSFILEQYQTWQEKGYTTQLPNKPFVQKFSRAYQAQQFMNLFTEIKKKK